MRKGIFTALIGLLVLVLISTTIISMKSSQRTEINPKPESFTHVTTQWLNTRIILDNNVTADAISDLTLGNIINSASCDWDDTSGLEQQLKDYYLAAMDSMGNGCYYYYDDLTFLDVQGGAITKDIDIVFRLACDQNAMIDGKYEFQTMFDQEILIEKTIEFVDSGIDCTVTIIDDQSALPDLQVVVTYP